jgi:peptidoglycan/xylan/chitin deacetylase (PgdA/CDA1 family)
LIKKIFYILKPVIPRSLQIYLRREIVRRQREKYRGTWPILPSSSNKPAYWQGWPEGKKTAFILTHDVESQIGHDKCKKLMQLEKDLGFVSSYNFVPEKYNDSPGLRKYLEDNGFEVGVHGLNHDGKLFSSKYIFDVRSKKINKYIKEWGAVGFRAPAMHHNLEWIKQLEIEYDLSTFDTDPFEPQSDGAGTIFPFVVTRNDERDSYVEMPYTLVQDFTLFILMKEKDIRIWKEKVDWIVDNGGMILVNVHPDYVSFDNNPTMEEFPVDLYIDLLNYIKTKYGGKYWNDIPKNVAAFVKKSLIKGSKNKMMETT